MAKGGAHSVLGTKSSALQLFHPSTIRAVSSHRRIAARAPDPRHLAERDVTSFASARAATSDAGGISGGHDDTAET